MKIRGNAFRLSADQRRRSAAAGRGGSLQKTTAC